MKNIENHKLISMPTSKSKQEKNKKNTATGTGPFKMWSGEKNGIDNCKIENSKTNKIKK